MVKLLLIDITLLLLVLVKSDSIVQLSNYTREMNSECSTGLAFVDGKDKIKYTGRFSLPAYNKTVMARIDFQMKEKEELFGDGFKVICAIRTTPHWCAGSRYNKPNECECPDYTESVFDVYLHVIAEIKYSDKEARLIWTQWSFGVTYYSNIVKVPPIETDYKATLLFDEKAMNLESCKVTMLPSSTAKFCVSGLRDHTLKISSGQDIFIEGKDCVNYNFKDKAFRTNSLTFSFVEHSVCKRVKEYVCGFQTTAQTYASTSDACDIVVSKFAACLSTWMMLAVIGHIFL